MDKGALKAIGIGALIGLVLIIVVPFFAVGLYTVMSGPETEIVEVPVEQTVAFEETISCPPGTRDLDFCAYSNTRYTYVNDSFD